MFINDLIITQESLRNVDQISGMVSFVRNGGVFSLDLLDAPKLIQLYELEDGKIYIHDGLHRCYSMFKGGRTFLHPSEYQRHKVSYSWFEEVNPYDGWWTPYDPRIEVRKADLTFYKNKARFTYEQMLDPKDIVQWCRDHSYMYCDDRTKYKVSEIGTNNYSTIS